MDSQSLPKREANYVALTPVTFLKRAASVYADRTSVIYESTRFTWLETYVRCLRLASSLRSLLLLSKHDVVSVLAPNIPATYEMHFAVPMAGAVLNTINTRLDAHNIATILRHSSAKAFFVDCDYVPLARKVLVALAATGCRAPPVVVISDHHHATESQFGELVYENLIRRGDPNYVPEEVADEWDPIALNYTSGTTSEPKGVVYSHRGAYLSTLSLILGWQMRSHPVYLWSLPMFHCNGWTFTWGIAARGGTNVCLRSLTAANMYRNIATHGVTHMCCAPVLFNILLEAKPHDRREIASPVEILTGGAPPPAALLQKIEPLGFHVTHAYGLTEATGPVLLCEWQAQWNTLPQAEQAELKSRQGISVLTLAEVEVKDPETMKSVPRDGKTMGEIVIRGSSIMKGYYKNPEAMMESFKNGWLLTGDVGVIHPDGYLQIKDRSKDVIISGGENISTVELEDVLYRHPRVLEVAVVAMPHPRWGESPCAFVAIRKNASTGKTDDVKEEEILSYCRENLPHFMAPKRVEFLPELPKNATGKILKAPLRDLAKNFVVSEGSGRGFSKTLSKTPTVPTEISLELARENGTL